MKSVRKFFGHLCGGSGGKESKGKDDSPVSPPKENHEKEAEPTIIADDLEVTVNTAPRPIDHLTQSSYESLDGSPSIHRQTIDAACSVHRIYDVTPWKPEVLGNIAADKIFQEASEAYEAFVKESQGFTTVLLSFARQYSRDKRPDFQKCFAVYYRNKTGQGSREKIFDGSSSKLNDTGIDLEDPDQQQLREIDSKGKDLLGTIDNTRPTIDKCIEEAAKHDVKDSAKEKSQEDVAQQGLLAKFSAPGKHRRNMKQLKKNRKLLDEIHSEIESIISTIDRGIVVSDRTLSDDQELHKTGSRTLLSTSVDKISPSATVESPEETPVVTVEATEVPKDDLPDDEFETVEVPLEVTIGAVSDPPVQGELKEEKEDGKEAAIDAEAAHAVHEHVEPVIVEIKVKDDHKEIEVAELNELEKPNESVAEHATIDQSNVSEQEHADVIVPLRPSSPTLSLVKSKMKDSWEDLSDDKLVDYGSYLVLDPSANDEMVILRRSRSLDSLSSIGSGRSLSRYGSYEFVTNFEIKIAEKAETAKLEKKATAPSQKTKSQPKMTTDAGWRNTTSPIYKYTEVDYNPLGF